MKRNNRAHGTAVEADKSLSPLQEFFLSALESLVAVSRGPAPGPWEGALVKRAIYSTYLDCVAADIGEEARARLRGADKRRAEVLAIR